MRLRTQVFGVQQLQAKLASIAVHAVRETEDVYVGYTQSYAIHVHEREGLTHKEGKQAKYLEEPARKLYNSGEIWRIVRAVYATTGSVTKGLLLAGLRIQRESQKIVPVLTGALKNSAYTAKSSQAPAAATAAKIKSDAIRQKRSG